VFENRLNCSVDLFSLIEPVAQWFSNPPTNFLNPETVRPGGGLIEALDKDLVDRVHYFAEDYAMGHAMSGVDITCAQPGDNDGIIGAAVLARQRLDESHDRLKHAGGIDTLI